MFKKATLFCLLIIAEQSYGETLIAQAIESVYKQEKIKKFRKEANNLCRRAIGIEHCMNRNQTLILELVDGKSVSHSVEFVYPSVLEDDYPYFTLKETTTGGILGGGSCSKETILASQSALDGIKDRMKELVENFEYKDEVKNHKIFELLTK